MTWSIICVTSTRKPVLVPQARDQKGPTCQFSAMSGAADMGFKKSKAHLGPTDIRFDERELLKISEKHLAITKNFEPNDVLNIFERYGNLATCGDWKGLQTRKIMGSSCGKPNEEDIEDLILQGVPILATFDCCDFLVKLEKNEVYQSLKVKSEEEEVENNIEPHMTLIFGYGISAELRLLFLHFINSWNSTFCDNGAGKIDFLSIKEFHTVEIFCHPEGNFITQQEKTVTLECYGLTRKVEMAVVNASDYMFQTFQRRHGVVVFPREVTVLCLSLIIGYLRLGLQPSEDLSALKESFVNGLDAEMNYDLMLAADAIRLRELSVKSAFAYLKATEGWEGTQISENMSTSYTKEEWTDMQNRARKMSKIRVIPQRSSSRRMITS